jgi:hypothetical protein
LNEGWKKISREWKNKEEDVSSYWMTLGKRKVTGN